MFAKFGKISVLIAITAILLTSCAAPQVTLPTPDLDLVRTEAVQTAEAQMTREAALLPPAAPTPAPVITTTPIVITATSPILSGGTSGGSSGGSSGGYSGTPIPTWTPVIYRAEFVTQNYLDGYPCPTGQDIDFQLTFKNTGAATWNNSYYYKMLWETVPIAKNTQYPLTTNVAPGKNAVLTIDVVCPTTPGGPWTTQWGLVNDNGAVFAKFYFKFFTVLHQEPTPTKTPTQSPG